MYEMIQENTGIIITAAVCLAALLLLMVVWRTISPRVAGRRGQRLGISEYHELDKMRRLVLVRRDQTEHLILIGGPQDVVIETGIGARTPAIEPPGAMPRGEEESTPSAPPLRAPPRPAVFGDRRPPPLRAPDGPPRPRDEEP